MNMPERFLSVVLTMIPLIFAISLLLVSQQGATPEQPIPLPPNPEATVEVTTMPIDTTLYEPSRYGIPDTIGGYKVLAVRTSENTECFPESMMMIELQVNESSVDEFLASDAGNNIQGAFDALGLNRETVRWSISGPSATKEELIRSNEQWNEAMRSGGCIKLGRPIPLTPSDNK